MHRRSFTPSGNILAKSRANPNGRDYFSRRGERARKKSVRTEIYESSLDFRSVLSEKISQLYDAAVAEARRVR